MERIVDILAGSLDPSLQLWRAEPITHQRPQHLLARVVHPFRRIGCGRSRKQGAGSQNIGKALKAWCFDLRL
jgi:hypothetical protein